MSVQPIDPPMSRPLPGRSAPPTPRRPRHWLRWGVAALVLAGAAGVAVLVLSGDGGKAPPAPPAPTGNSSGLTVTTAPVQSMVMTRRLMVTGSLAAWDELPIGTSTSGLAIVQVLVDEGDKVKAGQVLARFDDSVLRADLMQKEAALKEAEALSAEAKANVRRAEELSKSNAVSARELDSRRATAATAAARVGVAQANREQALARLQQTEIKAPADGTVSLRNARLGAVMSAGGTELFRLIRDDRIELAADVPELDLIGLAPGQKVLLSVNGSAGAPHEGKVRLVAPTVDPKTRMGTVKIDVAASPDLRPGMFVTGMVQLGSMTAPTVPENALVYKDARPLVFVLGDGNTAEMRPVETGARENGQVALLKGVTPGETVVVAGAGYLKDGDTVTVADRMPDVPVAPLPAQN